MEISTLSKAWQISVNEKFNKFSVAAYRNTK